MNKTSNTYQIVYSAIMVIVVGAVLAFIYMTLRPKQVENINNDTRKQILGAIHVTPSSDATVKDDFSKYIVSEFLVNDKGEITDSTKDVAFGVSMKKNVKEADRKLPVFVANVDGTKKYIIPIYGAGLWGPIWGYVAVEPDGQTVYGTNFSHESETPGLGARITEQTFQDEFKGKKLYVDGAFKSVEVLKKGQKSTTGAESVDAISGATITSRGVSTMMKDCLGYYDGFFKKLQSETTK